MVKLESLKLQEQEKLQQISETIQTRRGWSDIFKVLKEEPPIPLDLHTSKLRTCLHRKSQAKLIVTDQ